MFLTANEMLFDVNRTSVNKQAVKYYVHLVQNAH